MPFSLILCDGEGLPTLTLDHHDDHRIVQFAELGSEAVSFELVDAEFSATWQPDGPDRGWHVVARGVTQRALGVESGIPASIEMFARLDAADNVSYSYTINAGWLRRDLSDCTSPRSPPRHLADRVEP